MKNRIKNILLIFTMVILPLSAVNKMDLAGNWNTINKSNVNGQTTIEKEYLTINHNKTFNVVFLVSVQKGNVFIKDLRIEGRGIWEVRDNILVFVVQNIFVPSVQNVNGVSQASINKIAETFKSKYTYNPIHIKTIKFLNDNSLILVSPNLREITYSR